MKKLVSAVLAGFMAASLVGCSGSGNDNGSTASSSGSSDMKIAMITDSGDITDQSFNQTTYEASKEWAKDNGADFKYYKPAKATDEARIQSVETAIDDGYNTIVMPGYLFAKTVVETSTKYPDVKFIALDLSEGDILSAALGDKYDYNPSNWDVSKYYNTKNTYCAIYKEEIPGYMAGYAAVKLGYTKLGFLGGMAVPAVMRYGYGYVQGAGAAAKELGETVDMNYAYAGAFTPDPKFKATMDTWYSNGTQVVFACGGSIYSNVAEAAKAANGKFIGVDSDQKKQIDGEYGDGMTVTSAMKGLAPTVKDTLTAIKDGKWSDYAGKIDDLGIVDGDDPSKNYVQLGTTEWADGKFTEDDYKKLVKDIADGTIKVSNDVSADQPSDPNVKVDYQGQLS